jgi:TIR domain-containing protein
MGGIFICYRRADAEGWAGRLSDSLKAELGNVNIFRDIDDIPPGVEFDNYINEAVGSCDVLIALIGPHWLTITDKKGTRRLDDPNDFIPLEILTALKRDVRVIPALVGNAQMPEMDQLPEGIKALARRQAYELSDARWADDTRKLAEVLRPIVKPKHSLSRNLKIAVAALAALIVLAGGAFGFKLWRDRQAESARQAVEKAEQERLAALKAAEERQGEIERQRQEEELKRQADADRLGLEREAQRKAELERQRRELEAQRLADLDRQKKELDAQRQADLERQRREQEAQRQTELERQRRAQEAQRQAEAERLRKEQEARRLAEEKKLRPYGPDTCIQGYVWREATPSDHVCVTPATRDQTARDNSLAASRRSRTGGPYGPDTCITGYVWREAVANDRVCVTPAVRDQAARDNSQRQLRIVR